MDIEVVVVGTLGERLEGGVVEVGMLIKGIKGVEVGEGLWVIKIIRIWRGRFQFFGYKFYNKSK